MSVAGVGIAAPGQSQAQITARFTDTGAYCATSEELAFLKLINDYRKSKGLGALVLTQSLGAASEHHSKSMAENNYFSHTLIPEGISWSQNMANHGYNYNTWKAENIAAGNSDPLATFNQWKDSAGHNANMLGANFNAIGIGHYYKAGAPYQGHYWTTDFGGYVDAAAKTCPDGTDGGFLSSDGSFKVARTGHTSNSRQGGHCLDGRQDTSWYTTVTTPPSYAYVWFDFGAARTFDTVKWKFNRTNYADYFEIQVSNDRTSWTKIGQGTNAPSNTWQTLNKKATGRYVRFLFRNPNRDAKLGYLSEVRIYP